MAFARIGRWLGRHHPDTLPTRLHRRRIYVLPTPSGLAFVAALLVLLIGSINYGLNLGHALVFLLAGLGVVSTVQACRNLSALVVTQIHAEPVFAGAPLIVQLTLENPQPRARTAVRVELAGQATPLDIAPADRAIASLPQPTRQRGQLPVGPITISTTWPLGLVRAWSVVRTESSSLVYPAPEADPPPLPHGHPSDGGRPQGVGDEDFSGLRPHRRNDSPRHIAWKAVAAGRPMLTKEFTGYQTESTVLDWTTLPDALNPDARAARLAAWALEAHTRGLKYALCTPAERLPAGRGAAHLAACLARLAVA